MNRRILPLILITAMLLLGAAPVDAQFGRREPRKIKVLYVTGQNNHDWPFTSRHWPAVLEKTGRFKVTRTENPADYLARVDLNAFDLIFLDYFGDRWGETAERRFQRAVTRGLGVFVLHAANNAFYGWEDYEKMVGICFREKSGHGAFHPFDVDVIDRNHPITRDLPHLKAHPDELYHRMHRSPGSNFRVLLSAQSSSDKGGTGNEEPMALISRFGRGRIFHTTLGHVWPNRESDRVSVADPQLQLLVARGAEWAATGDCKISCESFGIEPFVTGRARARSPWVMRCVLEGRARMIVIGLDEMMNVAFDATHCEPYVVWAGSLKLQGAVFDAVHGPQPQIQGLPFWKNELIAASPVVVGAKDREFRFLGYRFDDGEIVLRYRPANLPEALVEERLEYGETQPRYRSGTRPLIRRFKISGYPEGRGLKVTRLSRSNPDVLPNGEHELIENFRVESEVKSR